MASICLGCTTRYAAGLSECPHCGGSEREDEHTLKATAGTGGTPAEQAESVEYGQEPPEEKPAASPAGRRSRARPASDPA